MTAPTSRRALLAQAGLVAGIAGAGAVGLKAVAGDTGATAAPTPLGGRSLPRVAQGRDWRIVFGDLAPGTAPSASTPRLPQGALVDGDGAPLGTLESSLMPSTGGVTHLHRIDLGDGGLIGMGPGTLADATFVILGGTGRYQGASGTYHAVQRPRETGGDGTATFTFDIRTPEA
jgi:hypothetical protein